MSDFDFKKHSLERLEEWLCDAMGQSGASSQEIYDTITNVVEEHVNYYQKGFEKTNQLLSLLKGNLNHDVYEAVKKEYDYYEGSVNNTWEEHYYPEETTKKNAPLSYKEAIQKGWTMTDDSFWIHPSKDDHMPPSNKKERWILKTEVDGLTGELFITLPDELLEKADLNEGDEVEWVNNLNGTYTVRKVTKPLGSDEC